MDPPHWIFGTCGTTKPPRSNHAKVKMSNVQASGCLNIQCPSPKPRNFQCQFALEQLWMGCADGLGTSKRKRVWKCHQQEIRLVGRQLLDCQEETLLSSSHDVQALFNFSHIVSHDHDHTTSDPRRPRSSNVQCPGSIAIKYPISKPAAWSNTRYP